MFKLSVIDLVKFPYLDHLSDLGDLHSGKIRKNVNVWAECSYCLAQSYLFDVDYPMGVHEGGHRQQSSTGLVVVNSRLRWISYVLTSWTWAAIPTIKTVCSIIT